jgi:hypothetical protein
MMVARDGVEPPTPAFSAKINSEYNDFVARVALEVVDSAWWKQELRVKSAGSGTTTLPSNERASWHLLFAVA